jgi:hypothetical protein
MSASSQFSLRGPCRTASFSGLIFIGLPHDRTSARSAKKAIAIYAIDLLSQWRNAGVMAHASHVVAELPQFIRDSDAADLSEAERQHIIDTVAAHPLAGDEIRGSGGVRKIRFAGRGKGKSGGYRVVTAYFGHDAPVYLVALLSKGDRANFSASEIAEFRQWTLDIAQYWRGRRS